MKAAAFEDGEPANTFALVVAQAFPQGGGQGTFGLGFRVQQLIPQGMPVGAGAGPEGRDLISQGQRVAAGEMEGVVFPRAGALAHGPQNSEELQGQLDDGAIGQADEIIVALNGFQGELERNGRAVGGLEVASGGEQESPSSSV